MQRSWVTIAGLVRNELTGDIGDGDGDKLGTNRPVFILFSRVYAFSARDYILDKPKAIWLNHAMKAHKPEEKEEFNLINLAQKYANEDTARALLEGMLWPKGPVCPHCKNHTEKPIYKLEADKQSNAPVRKGVYKCGACREQFSVTVGTVFEGSHVSISKWVMAMFILCSAKKSISANQLHRMLGVTYKTAWFMAHRIRFAMTPNHWAEPKLTGTVEVDETFVGPKSDVRRSKSSKLAVVALVQRDGIARVKVISSVTQKNLGQALHECVEKSAVVNTDEHAAYRNPLKMWKAHHAVNHSKYEYHRKNDDGSVATTNSAESFFSLLKRGIVGSWHHVSHEHLSRYANEFAFRWSHRHTTDGKRMEALVPMIQNKRLMYRRP
jgi:transposase-like protein